LDALSNKSIYINSLNDLINYTEKKDCRL